MNRVFVLVAILVAVTALIIWVAGGAGQVFSAAGSSPALLYNLVLLGLVLTSVVLRWRGSISEALQYSLIWLALFAALIVGYSYRDDFKSVWQRVAGEVSPASPMQRSDAEVVLRRTADGHFRADVDVNGVSIRMLADTGATSIALSESDARRAGIDVDQLQYTMIVSTANGDAQAAPVTLREVRVGSIVRRDVKAAVSRGLSGSLLGMSFFNTLSRFTIEADELVLKD
ncbi:MAG: TIGR02281 family clan AA aspartic protease [Alphaproteobacteria bacterium]|nr:TIGR02281 family clan AA aspartic protease [Alphaproteobacteria bacterium]